MLAYPLTATTRLHFTGSLPRNCNQSPNMHLISEWRIFQLLDKLRPTAAGLNQLPACFLRLGTPVLYKPPPRLFNLSIATSTVTMQWKVAQIQPVSKLSVPTCNAYFRPISITPVLSYQPSVTELFRLLRLVSGTVYNSTSHPRSHCQSSTVALRHIFSGAASSDYVVVPQKWHRHFRTRQSFFLLTC